jgi:hypothetical protein
MNKKNIQILIAIALSVVLVLILYGNLSKTAGGSAGKQGKEVIGVAEKVRPLFETKKIDKLPEEEIVSDRDPFAPVPVVTQLAPSAVSDLELNGITTNAKGKPMALISGEMVQVGGRIAGFTVTSITKDKVVVTDGKDTKTLTLER